jgi:hypothetical protein
VQQKKSLIPVAVVMSLTLGLAPFTPEPHIIGKLKWIIGGGQGMKLMDYFDLLLHGSPWIFLIYAVFSYFQQKRSIKD